MTVRKLVKRQVRRVRSRTANTELGRVLRTGYRRLLVDRPQYERNFVMHTGPKHAVIRARKGSEEPRVGILLSGGCDLATAFTAAPLIGETVRGTVGIANIGTGSILGSHRTDQLLQTLDGVVDHIDTEEVTSKLDLTPHFFSPRLFTEPDFGIVDHPQFGRFPKTVIVLSIGSDLMRAVYRHKEHGYLVDPGGFWLKNLDGNTLPDPEIARWFKQHFVPAGRLEASDFQDNMGKVITTLRERIGAEVIVYNALVVEPGSDHHNYQLLPGSHPMRRREFAVALAELSAELDFHVVDIDRIMKLQGVQEQVDFAHIPTQKAMPIGAEVYRILREMEVVS